MFFILNITRKRSSERSLYLLIRAGIFGRDTGEIVSWNWVGTKYGTESAMSHKMLIFKAEIDFSSFHSFSTPSHGIAASENKFHSLARNCKRLKRPGIDSKEPIPLVYV
jgi:hypothetical protein